MTKRLTDIELRRQAIQKIMRSQIRLKHSLAADEELNMLLPDTLEEFDSSIGKGQIKRLKSSVNDLLENL